MKYQGIKKLYYSISEISEMLGIKQSVIRYWESEFKELKPQKNRAGNRIYKKDDIAILRMIHHYVHEKHLSIHEANEVIVDLKKEGLYKRKIQELNKIAPIPVTETPEEVEEETPVIETPQEDEVEEIQTKETEEITSEPEFEIVRPTEETFIYPLDDIQEEEETEEGNEQEEDILPEPEPEPEVIEEEVVVVPEDIEIPEPEIIPEPKIIPEPVNEEPKTDPALKELLKKISGNIKDIIDILNE
jgi:DNA-binding transcriptional MerR regulator